MGKAKVKSRVLNAYTITVFVLLTVLFLVGSVRISITYRSLNSVIDRHTALQNAAYELQQGSDYLTEQVRLFVISQKKEYCDNFFKEVNTTRRRDVALEVIEANTENENIRQILENTLSYSNELLKTEEYAVRLVAESINDDLSTYDSAIQNTVLSEADLQLSPEAQLEKARELLFGDAYLDQKTRIHSNINIALDAILNSTNEEKEALRASYRNLSGIQNFLSLLALIAVVIFILLFRGHYVQPLLKFTRLMEKKEELPLEGSEELQIFASTYNKLLEQIQSDQVELTYEASHDSLTGLYNRKIFDDVRNTMSDATMLLIDIDNFKGINDTYGHDIGDQVLQKLARILKENFRSEDYVCRIGGDEFAVLMLHVNSSLKYLVENKIKAISAAMGDVSDGLPFNSLSIGVALADRENPGEDIYVDCDKALYEAKEAGRATYRFYQ